MYLVYKGTDMNAMFFYQMALTVKKKIGIIKWNWVGSGW